MLMVHAIQNFLFSPGKSAHILESLRADNIQWLHAVKYFVNQHMILALAAVDLSFLGFHMILLNSNSFINYII